MKKITVFALCTSLLPVSTAALAQSRGSFGNGPPDGPPRFDGGLRNGGSREMGEKGGLIRLWRGIGHLDERGQQLSKAQSKRVVALVLPWSKKPAMTQNDAQSLHQKLEAILTSAQKTTLDAGPRGFGPPDGMRPEGAPRNPRPFGAGPDGRGPDGRGPDGLRPRGERPFGGPDADGPPDGGFGPRGGRGGGRGRGGRGPGGMPLDPAQRQTVRAWNENANPFYAPTGNAAWKNLPGAFQQDEARRYRDNRAALETLSRQSR